MLKVFFFSLIRSRYKLILMNVRFESKSDIRPETLLVELMNFTVSNSTNCCNLIGKLNMLIYYKFCFCLFFKLSCFLCSIYLMFTSHGWNSFESFFQNARSFFERSYFPFMINYRYLFKKSVLFGNLKILND